MAIINKGKQSVVGAFSYKESSTVIVVRMAGGLGNQIFQLGAALLLARTSGDYKIILDDSALRNYGVARENEILKFFDFDRLNIDIRFGNSFIANFRIPKLIPIKKQKYPFVSDANFQYVIQKPNRYFTILDGDFHEKTTLQDAKHCQFGCGCFVFVKETE